jgi:hypothetical protein
MGQLRKLDDATVLAIVDRCRKGANQAHVGREFGVSQATVSGIVCGRTYKDVTGIVEPIGPLRKSRVDVLHDNVHATRKRLVYVRCLGCRRGVEKQAGTVLDANGAVLCSICEGRRKK